NNRLDVVSGTTYTPGGNVTATHVDINGTFNAPASGTITFSGDWTNNGTFTNNGGTVAVGSSLPVSNITGSSVNTFNNFTSTAPNKTLQFKSGATTTVAGLLNINSGSDQGTIIRSTVSGSQ